MQRISNLTVSPIVSNKQAPPIVPGSQVLVRTGRKGTFSNWIFGVVISECKVIETLFDTELVVRAGAPTGEIVKTVPVGTVITENMDGSFITHLGRHSLPTRALLPSVVDKEWSFDNGKIGYEQPDLTKFCVSPKYVDLVRYTVTSYQVRVLYGNLSREDVIAGAGESCSGIQCVMPIHPI